MKTIVSSLPSAVRFLICSCSLTLATQSSLWGQKLSELPVRLPDGGYIIQRTDFFPPTYIKSDGVSSDQDPSIAVPKAEPYTDYFEVKIRSESFTILEMVPSAERGQTFKPKGGIFVGISDRSSWAFEKDPGDKFKSRITLIPEKILEKDLPARGGPIGGLLETGYAATRNLISMCTDLIDWNSVHGWNGDSFSGALADGDRFLGNKVLDPSGRLDKILCKIDAPKANGAGYSLTFQLSYSTSDGQLSEVSVWRDMLGKNVMLYDFRVLNATPIPRNFSFSDYWTEFKTIVTQTIYFNPETGAIEMDNLFGRSLVGRLEVPSGINLLTRRRAVFAAIIVLTAISGLVFVNPWFTGVN